MSVNGKLKRGSYDIVATSFSVCAKTVERIWQRAKSSQINEPGAVNVCNKYSGPKFRKRIEIDPDKVSEIPLRRRTNIRSMSAAFTMAKSPLHRRIKEGFIRPHSNALKPYLTDSNKRARLQFCLSMLDGNSLSNDPSLKNMLNYVRIDEKWFYMTKDAHKYYLLPEEDEPYRTCKSKRFIAKIMFLAAFARPRFDSLRNQEFPGKIGIFPFIFKEPAKRNSKNRIAGTLEIKPILSVTKDVIRACLIGQVLLAIRSKWPLCDMMETIFIQQDNEKPHIEPNDVEFIEAASRDGFDIRLTFELTNSPDFNVLDLGFFQAIQSLQHQEAPNTIDELIHVVEKAFEDLSTESLNNVFLSFQNAMIQVMKVGGGNNYILSHMGKKKIERAGNLPLQLQCDREIMENAMIHLQQG